MPWYEWHGEELVLHLRIQPRARRAGIGGIHDGRLKVRVQAPPIEGKANEAVAALLAAAFRVPGNAVRLGRGRNSRNKTFVIRAPFQLPEWFRSFDTE